MGDADSTDKATMMRLPEALLLHGEGKFVPARIFCQKCYGGRYAGKLGDQGDELYGRRLGVSICSVPAGVVLVLPWFC